LLSSVPSLRRRDAIEEEDAIKYHATGPGGIEEEANVTPEAWAEEFARCKYVTEDRNRRCIAIAAA
jgi:hypothetical protein